VIAVRVFDEGGEGGIDQVKLESTEPPRRGLVITSGVWDFSRSVTHSMRSVGFDEKSVNEFAATKDDGPHHGTAVWESQGFDDYDGGAWYLGRDSPYLNPLPVKTSYLPGKIDDSDRLS